MGVGAPALDLSVWATKPDDSVLVAGLGSTLESEAVGSSSANFFRRSRSSLGGKTTTGFSAESLVVSAVSPVFGFSASALGSDGESGADAGVEPPQPARTRLSNKVAPRTA